MNIDPSEKEKFNKIADEWWDPYGKFAPLHVINPLRSNYVSEKVNLQDKNVIDVACGGGLLGPLKVRRWQAQPRADRHAAQRQGVTLMIAYCMRFHPLITQLKEALDARLAGDLFQLSIWTEQHTERLPNSWMCRAETLGGGQLFSHGCHYIDLLLWFLGQPLRGMHMGTNHGTPWMEREGTSNVCLEFPQGRLGYHFGTWGARGSSPAI